MRIVKSYLAASVGIAIGIMAMMYVGSPMTELNFWTLLTRLFVSLTLFAVALIFCDFGWQMYNDAIGDPKVKKIDRIPTHTNEWRDAR